MTVQKRSVCLALAVLLCAGLCFSLSGCDDGPSVEKFYSDTQNGTYNAIELNWGKDCSATYFIEEEYGIWIDGDGKYLFHFDSETFLHSSKETGGLEVEIATRESYYRSVIREDSSPTGIFCNAAKGLTGYCIFDETEAVVSIPPENIFCSLLSYQPDKPIILTKVKLPEEEIIPLETAVKEMNYVPKAYADFFANRGNVVLSCEEVNFRIDGATMTGKWHTGGTDVPIRMELNEKVPYLELFDVSAFRENKILEACFNLVDENLIEMVGCSGAAFYAKPTAPIKVTVTRHPPAEPDPTPPLPGQ